MPKNFAIPISVFFTAGSDVKYSVSTIATLTPTTAHSTTRPAIAGWASGDAAPRRVVAASARAAVMMISRSLTRP